MKTSIVALALFVSSFAHALTGEQLNECLYNNESDIQSAANLVSQMNAEGYLNQLDVFEKATAADVASCLDAKIVMIQEYAKALAKKNAGN